MSRAWPWPPGVLCLQTVCLLRAEALSLPVPGYICPEGPCRWPPASPHSLQVSRPHSPSSPTLEQGQDQGSRGQEPAVPSSAAAPPLSRGMTGLTPRRGGRCDEEAGAERAGVPPWFLWICLIPRYSQPFTVAEGRGGEEEGGLGCIPPSLLPAPAPRSHLTHLQVAGPGSQGLCAHGGSSTEYGALSNRPRISSRPPLGARSPCPDPWSWQINESTNTNSRCAGQKRRRGQRRRDGSGMAGLGCGEAGLAPEERKGAHTPAGVLQP